MFPFFYNAVTRLFVYLLRLLHHMFRLLKFSNFNFIFIYVICYLIADWGNRFRAVDIDGNIRGITILFSCVKYCCLYILCAFIKVELILGNIITFQLYIYTVEKKRERDITFLRNLYCLHSYARIYFYMHSIPFFLLNSEKRVCVGICLCMCI